MTREEVMALADDEEFCRRIWKTRERHHMRQWAEWSERKQQEWDAMPWYRKLLSARPL